MRLTEEKTMHAVAPEEVMAYLDGELGAEDAVAVAAHLRECGYCAVIAEELGGVSRELRAWTVEAAPQRLEREVRKAVGENAAGTRRRAGRKFWVWSGVAAGIVVVVGLLMVPTMGNYRRVATPYMMAPMESSLTQSQSAVVAQEYYGNDRRNMAPLADSPAGLVAPAPSSTSMQGKGDRFRGGVENLGTAPLVGGGGGGAPSGYVAQAPMIARTASLTVLVKDVANARTSLEGLMAHEQGYAAQLTFSTPDGGARSLQASLRVPSGQLPGALDSLRKLGRVEEETQGGEEVTQQHTDLVARLTNAREEEARLRALLAQRTGKIDDVLQVEEEIARVRGEIEQMEAEKKGLEHRVDFASVELKLMEEYAARLESPAEGTGTKLHNSFVAGLQNAGSSLLGLVLFAEEYGPVLLIWVVILGVPAWLVWRRYRRAQARLQ